MTGSGDGNPMLVFMCDDVDVFVGPVLVQDRSALFSTAIATADDAGCTPKTPGPLEILGVAGDPPSSG